MFQTDLDYTLQEGATISSPFQKYHACYWFAYAGMWFYGRERDSGSVLQNVTYLITAFIAGKSEITH